MLDIQVAELGCYLKLMENKENCKSQLVSQISQYCSDMVHL